MKPTDGELEPSVWERRARLLRERAEARLRLSLSVPSRVSTEELKRLIYELQVREIELEIQNEELRSTQVQLAESSDELELRQSQERLRLAAEATGFGAYDYDPRCKENAIWSPELYGILGLAKTTSAACSRLERLVHPEDREDFNSAIRHALEPGGAGRHHVEFRIVRPDGETRWVRNRGRTFFGGEDHNRVAVRVVGTIQDVTDLRIAEENLRKRNRQQEAVAMLGELALSERELEALFGRATATVAETLDVELCEVLELLPGGEELLLRSGVGWKAGLVGKGTVGTNRQSQAGYTLMADAPVIVDDLREEERFSGPHLLFDHGVISGMTCVIRGPDRQPWGVLGTHSKRRVTFTPDDINFLVSVANVLGNAIQHHRIEKALHEANRVLEQRVKERTKEWRRMSKVFMDATDPIFILNMGGNVLDSNEEVERLLGWKREELIGRSIKMIVPSELHHQTDQRLECCRNGESVRNVEGHRVAKNGEIIPVLLTFSLLFDDDGTPSGIATIAKDYRELKQAQVALRESHALAEMHRDVAYMANRARNLEDALAFCLERVAFYNGWVFGHAWFPSGSDPDTILPASECYATAPERFEAFREATLRLKPKRGEGLPGRVYASGKPEWTTDIEEKLTFRADIARDLGIRTAAAFPILVGDDVVGVLEFFSDRTLEVDPRIEQSMAAIGAQLGRVIERSEAERTLKESEARLSQLTAQLRDVVWMHDAETFDMIYCSSAFERIFGRPCEVLERDPRAFLETIHEEDRERVAAAVRKMETGGDFNEEYRIRRPDGSIRWVRDRGYPVRDETGRVYRFVGTAEDITEHMDAQREMKRLEGEVTRATEGERRRIARDLHDSVGALLSSTKLRLDILKNDIAEGSSLDPSEIETIDKLINEALTQTRALTLGLYPVGEHPEDLMAALANFVANVRIHAALKCRFWCRGSVVIGDPQVANHLFRIAQEAVNNAVKHSGGNQITVALRAEGGHAVVSVEDNGVGFDPKERGRAGAGAGLRILRYRAEAIGAKLDIVAQRGQGTKVICIVPLQRVEEANRLEEE